MNRQHGVTYIDDLPDLNDLTETPVVHMVPDQDKYKKFIRTGTGNPAMESGMSRNRVQAQDPMPPQQDDNNSQIYEQPHPHHQNMYNCIDIANHIKTCPICSKLYNDDKTLYILCIVLLCIVIIILIKRILNV
jgi:hypothetical protein